MQLEQLFPPRSPRNIDNLPNITQTPLPEKNTSEVTNETIPSLSEVDLCVESLEKEDFCDRHLIIHKTNVETIDLNNDEFSRFEDYMKKEIHLICNKVPKELKVNPPKPSDLKITITVEEILGIFGYKKGNEKDIFSCIGSGAFHFLPENVIDEFLTNVKVTKEKSLKNFIPETLLKKCYEEMKMQPDDVDYRIDLSDSYLTIDEELKKIIDHLAKKMEDQEKEGKINKTWAQFTYKTHLGKKLSSNSPNFWEEFINGLFFTKKNFSKYDAPVQFAIVRIIGNEGEKIEFILKKRMPRSCIYTSRAPVISLQNKQIKLEKDEGNPFNYTLQQCLIDKIFNIIRPMQKNWNVHNKNKFVYDPKDFVYLLTNKSKNEKYLGSDDVEEDKFNALIQSGNNPAQALISALKDAIKNHLKKRKESYLSLLFNAYDTVQKSSKKDIWGAVVKAVLVKTKNRNFSPHIKILNIMIEKEISFPLISAYLQLIGFIDLCLVEKTSSCFTTLRHGKQIHLQVTLDSKDTILLPFDIENSLTLLNENKAIFEQYNLFNLFTNYKFFNTRNCNFSNISKIYSLLEDKIQTISTSLYESTQKDLKIYGVILKTLPWNYKLSENYQNLFISLPSVKKDDPHKEVLLPALKSYYQLDEQTLKSIIKSVEKGIEGEKWKNFILYLNTVPSLQNFSWLSLKQFLKLISTNNDKKNIGKEIGIKNNLFDPLLKSWAVSKHGKRISQLLSMKEVQIYYTMPLEKLHHFLAAYKISKEKNEDVNKLSEQILLECAKDSIQKNPQNLKNLPLDLFKDIALHFFENGNIEKSIVITDLLSIIESSLWKNFFSSLVENNDSNHLRKVISWWRYSIQIPKTELVNTILTLLEKIHHHYEEDFKVFCLELIEKLKDYNLNENQEKRLAPFIVEKFAIEVSKLAKRDFNLENKIDSSLASLEDKIDLYLKILSVYAKLENKESFFSFFLFLDKNYKEYLTNSTSLIDILLPLISIFNHKQRLKLLEYDFLLSNPKIINNILTLLNDDNLGTFQKEELLAASLKHPKLMYSNIERWITTILNRSQNTSSTKTLTLPSVSIGYILRHHLNNILDHLIVSDNYLKAIQLIVMTNTYQITLKEIPTKTLNRLIDLIILEKNPSQFLSLFWSFSSSLRSQALKNSIKDSLLKLNDFLAKNFINLNELPAAQQAINRILDLDPSCIENCENAITKLWSSKLEEEKNIELWSSWFQKIKKEKIWICHQLNYCQAVEEYCGPEACLEAIKELDYQIEDERFILFIENTASKHCLNNTSKMIKPWITWLSSKSLFHLKIWNELIFLGVTNNKNVFLTVCELIQNTEALKKIIQNKKNNLCKIDYYQVSQFIENLCSQVSNVPLFVFLNKYLLLGPQLKPHLNEIHLVSVASEVSKAFSKEKLPEEYSSLLFALDEHYEKINTYKHALTPMSDIIIRLFCAQNTPKIVTSKAHKILENLSLLPAFSQESINLLLVYFLSLAKSTNHQIDNKETLQHFFKTPLDILRKCKDAYTANLFSLIIISTKSPYLKETIDYFFNPQHKPPTNINLEKLHAVATNNVYLFLLEIFNENSCSYHVDIYLKPHLNLLIEALGIKNAANIFAVYSCNLVKQIRKKIDFHTWKGSMELAYANKILWIKHAALSFQIEYIENFYETWSLRFFMEENKESFLDNSIDLLTSMINVSNDTMLDGKFKETLSYTLINVFTEVYMDYYCFQKKENYPQDKEALKKYFKITLQCAQSLSNTLRNESLENIFKVMYIWDIDCFDIWFEMITTKKPIKNLTNDFQDTLNSDFRVTLEYLHEKFNDKILAKLRTPKEIYTICRYLINVDSPSSVTEAFFLYENSLEKNLLIHEDIQRLMLLKLIETSTNFTKLWVNKKEIINNPFKIFFIFQLWLSTESCLYKSFSMMREKNIDRAFISVLNNTRKTSELSLVKIKEEINIPIFGLIGSMLEGIAIASSEIQKIMGKKTSLKQVILVYKLYDIATKLIKKERRLVTKSHTFMYVAEKLKEILINFLGHLSDYHISHPEEKKFQDLANFLNKEKSTFQMNKISSEDFWKMLLKSLFENTNLKPSTTIHSFQSNNANDKNSNDLFIEPISFDFISFLAPLDDILKQYEHNEKSKTNTHKKKNNNFLESNEPLIDAKTSVALLLKGIIEELKSLAQSFGLSELRESILDISQNKHFKDIKLSTDLYLKKDIFYMDLANKLVEKASDSPLIRKHDLSELQKFIID